MLWLFSVLILGGFCSAFVSADDMIQWDGKQMFEAGKNYVVNKGVIIRENVEIPQGTTVTVNSGVGLLTMKNAELSVKGTLSISESGSICTSGAVKFCEGSQVNLLGSWVIRKGSAAEISGNLAISSGGMVTLSGKMNITQTGKVSGDGKIKLYYFLDIQNSGEITAGIIPPKPHVVDGVTYVGEVLLVNKKYSIPSTYGDRLDDAAYSAFLDMKADAKTAGFNLNIISGFRSYSHQTNTYAYWCNLYGEDYAKMVSAKPGTSEHQTGLAMDINSIQTSYGDTKEGKWLAANCWKYGFIIRYQKDKTDITGYYYEPWHLRYLGKEIAKMVYDSGLCLEEFLGVN